MTEASRTTSAWEGDTLKSLSQGACGEKREPKSKSSVSAPKGKWRDGLGIEMEYVGHYTVEKEVNPTRSEQGGQDGYRGEGV